MNKDIETSKERGSGLSAIDATDMRCNLGNIGGRLAILLDAYKDGLQDSGPCMEFMRVGIHEITIQTLNDALEELNGCMHQLAYAGGGW